MIRGDVLTDVEIVAEIGRRLQQYRLQQNVTQRALADRAGVSLRTVQNVEAGEDTQLSTMMRLLRALRRLDAIDAFLPEPRVSPIALHESGGRRRRRARKARHGA